MNTEEWIGIVAAMGVWTGILVAITRHLHSQRTQIIGDLREQIAAVAEEARVAHTALRTQIVDVTQTFANNYVRRDDFLAALRDINTNVVEARKDIGGVNNRIDLLIQGVQWRRGKDGDG